VITPIPKPHRSKRLKGAIDTRALPHAKLHLDVEPHFRSFVRSHGCLLAPWKKGDCGGGAEFAHITVGGRGLKGSDYHGVCLCTNHHTAGPDSYHNLGSVEAFDATHGTGLWKENALLLAEWSRRRR
jgi:hypothetical protein